MKRNYFSLFFIFFISLFFCGCFGSSDENEVSNETGNTNTTGTPSGSCDIKTFTLTEDNNIRAQHVKNINIDYNKHLVTISVFYGVELKNHQLTAQITVDKDATINGSRNNTVTIYFQDNGNSLESNFNVSVNEKYQEWKVVIFQVSGAEINSFFRGSYKAVNHDIDWQIGSKEIRSTEKKTTYPENTYWKYSPSSSDETKFNFFKTNNNVDQDIQEYTVKKIEGVDNMIMVSSNGSVFYMIKNETEINFSGKINRFGLCRGPSSSGVGGIEVGIGDPTDEDEWEYVETDEKGHFEVPKAKQGEEVVIVPGIDPETGEKIDLRNRDKTGDDVIRIPIIPWKPGDDMGIISVTEQDYSYKCSLVLSDKVPYLFADLKNYNVKIRVQNDGIGDSKAPFLNLAPEEGLTLDLLSLNMDSIPAGGYRESEVTVKLDDFISEDFVDKKINFSITDYDGRVWEDHVTLRFYRAPLKINFKFAEYSNSFGLVVTPDKEIVRFKFDQNFLRVPSKSSGYRVVLGCDSVDEEISYALGIHNPVSAVPESFDFEKNEPNDAESSATVLNVGDITADHLFKNDIDCFKIEGTATTFIPLEKNVSLYSHNRNFTAIDNDGFIYSINQNDNKIKKFKPGDDPEFDKAITVTGNIKAVTVDTSTGNLYLASCHSENQITLCEINELSNAGEVLRTYTGLPSTFSFSPNIALHCDNAGVLYYRHSKNIYKIELESFDSYEEPFLLDSIQGEIESSSMDNNCNMYLSYFFDSAWKCYKAAPDGTGEELTFASSFKDTIYDRVNDRIWVVNTSDRCLEVYKPDGTLIQRVESGDYSYYIDNNLKFLAIDPSTGVPFYRHNHSSGGYIQLIEIQ